MDVVSFIDNAINLFFDTLGFFAPIFACLLIAIESILPIMPLAVFITINFYYLGTFIGFLISWLFTCIGCYISYILCQKKLKKHFDYMLDKKEHKKLNRLMNRINNMSLEQIVILMAIPFTPAFLINIAAGLSNINKKKFIISIIIGKIFLVYFWGKIGTSLIESIKNPKILIQIALFVVVAFIISKFVNKKLNIE